MIRMLSFSVTMLLYLGWMMIQTSIVQATPCTTRCGLFGRSMYKGDDRKSSCKTLFGHPRLGHTCGTCIKYPVITDNCDNTSSSQFDICLQLAVDSQDIDIFRSARTRWSEVIKGDTTDFNDTTGLQTLPCGAYPSKIDDLYICGVSQAIDGRGNLVGTAGPLYTRIADSIPLIGFMRFDEVDIAGLRADGTLQQVILHEMGHVIGLGTTWVTKGVANRSSSGRQCSYTGVNANNEYKKITGCSSVPMEEDGGAATVFAHWDEECLQNELMTGLLSSAVSPLSNITIGSLNDLGYVVDYSKADPYTASNVNPACLCNRRELNEYPLVLNKNDDDPSIRSSHEHRANHRKLSEEGLTIATNYGQKLLQDNNKFYNTRSNEVRINQDLNYVAHLGIRIYYYKNDIIHDIWVTPA